MPDFNGLKGRLRWAASRTVTIARDEGVTGVALRSRDYLQRRRLRGKEFGAVPAGVGFAGAVLMIAGGELPQCWRYRVEQKRQAFAAMGVPFHVVNPLHIDAAMNDLNMSSLLIIYRRPVTPELLRLVDEARRLGVPVVYETDDMVYRPELLETNPNLDLIEPALRKALIAGAPAYAEMLALCDAAIVSTPALAEDIATRVPGPVTVVDNGVDAAMHAAARGVAKERSAGRIRSSDDGWFVIGYGSGSKDHDLDFALAEPAIRALMTKHANVRLKLVGPLTVPASLAPFRRRIEHTEMMPYGEYLYQMAQCDVAIAPLADHQFNTYKSQVKYIEAGLLGTAAVVSRTVYGNYVEDGVTGLVADDADGWLTALEKLFLDADLRHRLAEAAQRDVEKWDVDTNTVAQLWQVIEQVGVEVARA